MQPNGVVEANPLLTVWCEAPRFPKPQSPHILWGLTWAAVFNSSRSSLTFLTVPFSLFNISDLLTAYIVVLATPNYLDYTYGNLSITFKCHFLDFNVR
uniref:Uncharacterized protein n=1 Tax=Lepeophtheirus salmonis TaxID=72036 RepID=A0A0K2T4P6_LEPSM